MWRDIHTINIRFVNMRNEEEREEEEEGMKTYAADDRKGREFKKSIVLYEHQMFPNFPNSLYRETYLKSA